MTPFHLVFFIGRCVAFMVIAVVMLNDICGELDRRRDNEEIAGADRRPLQQRTR